MQDIPSCAYIIPTHDEFGRLFATVTRPGDTRWAVSIYGPEQGWIAVLHMQDVGPPIGDSHEFATDHHKDEAEEAFSEVPFLFGLADHNDQEQAKEEA